MKYLITCLTAVFLATVSSAQEPTPAIRRPASDEVSAHQPRGWTATYAQESSKDYIRRRAQEKSEARRARIEGYRAMGYTPLRPTHSSTPFMSHPPTWHVTHAWPYSATAAFWAYPGHAGPYIGP